MVSFKQRWIALAAYIIIALPIVMFELGWLRWYFGIPAAALLVYGLVWIYRTEYLHDDASLRLPIGHLVGICAFFGLFVAFSGICGLGVAQYDVPWRNALLRDLINYDWPVYYDDGNAMVYYCAFWMPSALVGKLFGWIGAEIALGVHVTAIIVVSYLLILSLLKIERPGRMWLMAVLMLGFSGLCYLGVIATNMVGYTQHGILTTGTGYVDYQAALGNGEPFNWHYRHNYESVRFVYNQLPYWLVVPLMLQHRHASNYMYLGLCLLPYSPWAFVGIIPLLIVAALGDLKETASSLGAVGVLKSIFSPANLASLIAIVPVFALFFLSSPQTGGSGEASAAFGLLSLSNFTPKIVLALIMFWVLEFGVYAVLIGKKFRTDPLFWAIIVVLLVAPFIWLGAARSRDFPMNATLPALFVLMIFVMDFLNERVCGKPYTLASLLLSIALFFGAMSPFSWTCLSASQMLMAHQVSIIDEHVYTYEGKDISKYRNFITDDPEEKLFFKYLAR